MIEIISRDRSVSDEELILYAQKLEQDSGQQVVPLTSAEACAAAFWGIDDIHVALEQNGYDSLSMTSDEICSDFLAEHEKTLHSSMVAAGWECIKKELDDWVTQYMDEPI